MLAMGLRRLFHYAGLRTNNLHLSLRVYIALVIFDSSSYTFLPIWAKIGRYGRFFAELFVFFHFFCFICNILEERFILIGY